MWQDSVSDIQNKIIEILVCRRLGKLSSEVLSDHIHMINKVTLYFYDFFRMSVLATDSFDLPNSKIFAMKSVLFDFLMTFLVLVSAS